ncbi:type II toxin-antitoxin system VapC family toxin [Candidatus Collierbacteria bacterium]|nr:type II toxin-antitoxin system VapC family toxin [Candidatus Collierbacteria bacterium]
MAKVFLDTNIFIDLIEGRGNKILASDLDQHHVYISPLSIHILFYVEKKRVPNPNSNATISQFEMVDLTRTLLEERSLVGPTDDLEDNIQLQSAIEADCDYFLTHDKQLLKMGYFGKTRILSSLAKNVI